MAAGTVTSGEHIRGEIDLVFIRRGNRYGIEVKLADGPGVTKSMQIALKDLGLKHIWVLYPGKQKYSLGSSITAWPVDETQNRPVSS